MDLRRRELSDNLRLRSKVGHIIRTHLHDQGGSVFRAKSLAESLGFTEVETPTLLQSSPEGAREFLVPTRTASTSGGPTFYALAQSPQQPKQLLVTSGAVSKYFQIAKCFRDEDGRKDRQPEFTQIDMEMAFVSGAPEALEEGGMRSTWNIGGQEVREVVEGLVKRIWREIKGVELEGWFRVMPYEVAMDVVCLPPSLIDGMVADGQYGSDKPDTRFEMYVSTLTR